MAKFYLVAVILTFVLQARTEIDFNDCKQVRTPEERALCLTQASEKFQIELQTYESFDSLTLKTFRLSSKSRTFDVGLGVAEGMHFEEPNDINSGQYMGTLLTPSFGLHWRNGGAINLSINYSKMAGNGAGDQGRKRNGRPKIDGRYSFSQNENQRWFFNSELNLPLASGSLYETFALGTPNVWGIGLGIARELSISSWSTQYGVKIQYDFDDNSEDLVDTGTGSQPNLVGSFYQRPIIAHVNYSTQFHWPNDSLGPGLYFDYGLTKSRLIVTNSPYNREATTTTYDPRVQLGGVEANYQHDFSDDFSVQVRLWKSIINSFADNLLVNIDDPSVAGSIGLEVKARMFF